MNEERDLRCTCEATGEKCVYGYYNCPHAVSLCPATDIKAGNKKSLQVQIEERLSDYDAEGAKLWGETVEELFKNGFRKGTFQDYGVVADVAEVLSMVERYLKECFPA